MLCNAKGHRSISTLFIIESVTTDLMEHGITADMDLPEAFVTKVSAKHFIT